MRGSLAGKSERSYATFGGLVRTEDRGGPMGRRWQNPSEILVQPGPFPDGSLPTVCSKPRDNRPQKVPEALMQIMSPRVKMAL